MDTIFVAADRNRRVLVQADLALASYWPVSIESWGFTPAYETLVGGNT